MKNVKRIISFILVTAMLLGVAIIPSYAADDQPVESEPIVARMYIGHRQHVDSTSGHTWIYIENLTKGSINVGAVTLPKGKGVAIGTYGTTVEDGPGLYYNVESWRYRNLTAEDYIGLSKDLTASDLQKVSDKIVNCNYWSYVLNCAYTAIKIWNTVPGQKLIYLYFPMLTKWQIAMKGDNTGFTMVDPARDEIFKQIDNGDSVIAMPTSPDVVSEPVLGEE